MTIHNDKLTNFLREHAPEAPDPKPGEMRRILEQIEASEKRWSFFRFLFSPKSLVPATVLAGVLAFLLIPRMHSPLEEPTELFLSQTVGDLFATEDETSANSAGSGLANPRRVGRPDRSARCPDRGIPRYHPRPVERLLR